MERLDLRTLVPGDIFREKDFRDAVAKFDWTQFRDKPVLVEGCASKTLPTWAYLVVTAQLVPLAKSVSYGEIRSPIPVYGKLGSSH
jgi:hypothetical protein